MRSIRKDHRGLSLQDVPNVLMIAVMIGGIGLGGILVVAALAASTTNATAQSFLGNVTSMFGNIGSQLPVVGTIVGVGLILGVVIAGLYFGTKSGAFGGGK